MMFVGSYIFFYRDDVAKWSSGVIRNYLEREVALKFCATAFSSVRRTFPNEGSKFSNFDVFYTTSLQLNAFKLHFLENEALSGKILLCIFHLFSHVQQLPVGYLVPFTPELATFKYTWYVFKFDFLEN